MTRQLVITLLLAFLLSCADGTPLPSTPNDPPAKQSALPTASPSSPNNTAATPETQNQKDQPMNNLLREIKKTVVFLGTAVPKPDGKSMDIKNIKATASLVQVKNVHHLVTAKHVVMEKVSSGFTSKLLDDAMVAIYNRKSPGLGVTPISFIKQHYGVKWIFHPNPNVDLAIIPFPIDPAQSDLLSIPDSLFVTPERLYEVYEVFFPSFQPGIAVQNKITPLFRAGTIALMQDDGTLLIDAPAFPGNSGSPVFLKPSPIRFDETGLSIGNDQLGGKFIGIVGGCITFQDLAMSVQTGRPRVIFEENTGLSIVSSVKLLNEIIDSDPFKQQLEQQLTRGQRIPTP